MKKNKYIYIIFENANRELEGKLLLTAYALLKKYNVIIGEKNELRQLIKHFPPGVILEKSIRKNSVERFKSWKKLGHKIVSLDEEALMYHDNKIYLKQNIDDYIHKYLDYFFLWSKKHKKMIFKTNIRKKSIIVGNPRIDILKEPWRKTYDNKANKIIKKYGEFIFISSRFGSINRNNPLNKLRGKNMITTKKYFIESKKLLSSFYKLPLKLRKKFPDKKIIIRPHPSESDAEWKKISNKIDNCEVIFKGSAIPWIIAAKNTIHNRDTIGLEGWILKYNTICYDPYHGKGLHDKLFKKISVICKDISQVKKQILKQKNTRLKYTQLDHWYANTKSKYFSFQKILTFISNLKVNKQKFSLIRILKIKLISIYSSLRKKFIELIDYRARLQKKYSDKKIGDFNYVEIKESLRTFERLLNSKQSNTKLIWLGKRVILINKD